MVLVFHNPMRDIARMNMGKRIRAARNRLKLTQGELAKAIGAEQSTISGWETDDTRRPSRDMVPRLAKALKVTQQYLEYGALSDRGRDFSYDFDDEETSAAVEKAALDVDMLAESLRMSVRSLVVGYGIDVPRDKIEAAAHAALSTYLTHLRLRTAENGEAA